MLTKKEQAIARARIKLRQSIDRACIARGEAQWTNGYRAAKFAGRVDGGPEEERLYAKEMQQFSFCASAEKQADRDIAALIRSIRLSYNPFRRRGKKTR